MTTLTFNGQQCATADGETVLDTLRRHALEVPYSCCEGNCQSCLLQCVDGNIPAAAQKGLKPALQQLNYFLACQCTATENISAVLPSGDSVYSPATLTDKQQLATDIWRLALSLTDNHYQAGQFFNLRHASGWIRSYSAASLPSQTSLLELHIRRLPNGRMSNWLIDDFAVGEQIDISGPHGSCIYTPEAPDQPLLMVGTGTGLAPLLGILHDALARNHRGPIHLYHGARSNDKLYYQAELSALAARHDNVYYQACTSTQDQIQTPNIITGRAADLALATLKDLTGWRVFLCGSPDMVKQTRTSAYLAGASLQNILADAFTMSAP